MSAPSPLAILIAELRVYASSPTLQAQIPTDLLHRAADTIDAQARELAALRGAQPGPERVRLGPALAGRAGLLVFRLRMLLAPQPPVWPALAVATVPAIPSAGAGDDASSRSSGDASLRARADVSGPPAGHVSSPAAPDLSSLHRGDASVPPADDASFDVDHDGSAGPHGFGDLDEPTDEAPAGPGVQP